MSDRRYGVYERFDTGDEWPLSSIPDALVEEAAKRIWVRRHDTPYRPGRARHNEYHDDYMADARAVFSVLFPGEEKEDE